MDNNFLQQLYVYSPHIIYNMAALLIAVQCSFLSIFTEGDIFTVGSREIRRLTISMIVPKLFLLL